MKINVSVVMMDMDNTLFDWLDSWYISFKNFLDVLIEQSGVSQITLENEIRKIFQKYGTSEYPFFIQEIPSLKKQYPSEDLLGKFAGAIQTYLSQKSNIHPYPGVIETLTTLKTQGCLRVVFTESQKSYTIMRMKLLNLDPLIDYVFSPLDNNSPDILIGTTGRNFNDPDELEYAQYRPIGKGEYKPDPKILLDILDQVGGNKGQCIYIGDSLMKDILMSQGAGVTDVLAKYGQSRNTIAYEQLRRVSHWTDDDILREKRIIESGGSVIPSYVLESDFGEILNLFDFVPFN